MTNHALEAAETAKFIEDAIDAIIQAKIEKATAELKAENERLKARVAELEISRIPRQEVRDKEALGYDNQLRRERGSELRDSGDWHASSDGRLWASDGLTD